MCLHLRRVLAAFLLCSTSLWADSNPVAATVEKLSQRGVQVSLDLYSDVFRVETPGQALHGTSQTWADLSTEVQLTRFSPKLAGLHAFASVHVNSVWNSRIDNATQALSGIQSRPGVTLAEIWIERTMSRFARLRLGKIDANRDFAYIENAFAFVNGTNSSNPTFVTLPNYTDSQPGIELLTKGKHLRLNLAAFTPIEGTGTLLMQEVGSDWSPGNRSGRVALGGWQLTARMPTLEGGLSASARGLYAIAEQEFWRGVRADGGEESVTAHVQWGTAPSLFSSLLRHFGAGITWNGVIESRPNDGVGLGFSRGHFSRWTGGGNETVIETFYRVQLLPQLSVSPDLQYMVRPGGAPHNLVAFGARVALSLKRPPE